MAVGYALKLVVPAACTGIGLIIGMASGGVAVSGAVAAWVLPTASVGVGTIGVSVAVKVLIETAEKAKRQPFEWTLPLLGVATGITISLWHELTDLPKIAQILIAGVAALWTVIAGACYTHEGYKWKCSAIALYAIPSLALLGWESSRNREKSFVTSLLEVPISTWFIIGISGLIAVVIVLLERARPTSS